jgi:uncharacterized membrane protein YgcG
MKCQALKDWVLQCESMSARSWPKRMVKHVKRCRPCRHFARSILRLEDAWKNQPLPKAAKKPSAAFLEQIAELENPPVKAEKTTPKKRKQAILQFRVARWAGAAAAVLLIAVGVMVFMLVTAGTSRASPSDVVERLIVLNLEMTNAEGADRKRMLEDNDHKFADEIAKAGLPDDERELAENLLEAARLLATSDDLDDEVDYFTHLGDELKTRFERAEKKGNVKEAERCSMFYQKYIVHDMRPFFDRIKQFGPPEKGPDKGGDKMFGMDKGFFDKGPFDKIFPKGLFDKGGKGPGKGGDREKGGFGNKGWPIGKLFGGGKGGHDKGGFDKGGFDKGGFDKGGFDKGGFGKGGDRDKGRDEFIRKLNDERIRAQEAWQKKMGNVFMPPQMGKKK